MKTGFSALVLELWYRMVWARHTMLVHASLLLDEDQGGDQVREPAAEGSAVVLEEVPPGVSRMSDLSSEAVISLAALGMDEEEDEETEEKVSRWKRREENLLPIGGLRR
jgi:hypothetical protein